MVLARGFTVTGVAAAVPGVSGWAFECRWGVWMRPAANGGFWNTPQQLNNLGASGRIDGRPAAVQNRALVSAHLSSLMMFLLHLKNNGYCNEMLSSRLRGK